MMLFYHSFYGFPCHLLTILYSFFITFCHSQRHCTIVEGSIDRVAKNLIVQNFESWNHRIQCDYLLHNVITSMHDVGDTTSSSSSCMWYTTYHYVPLCNNYNWNNTTDWIDSRVLQSCRQPSFGYERSLLQSRLPYSEIHSILCCRLVLLVLLQVSTTIFHSLVITFIRFQLVVS